MNCMPVAVTHAALPALWFRSAEPGCTSAIVWLHGIGERGDDPFVVAKYGLPAALAAGRAVADGDVLCPQLPAGQTWDPARVHAVVAAAQARYRAVALVGFSLGGLGVLDAVAEFGAVCPLHVSIAGRSSRAPGASQAGVRLLAIQGERDRQPAVSHFVAQVRQRGGIADDVIVPGADHFIAESALWLPQFQTALSVQGMAVRANPPMKAQAASG